MSTYRVLLPLVLASFSGATMLAQQPTTWWPDPLSGLMWTGTPMLITFDGYAGAQADCKGARVGGYSDWRLPTLSEVDSAIKLVKVKYPLLQIPFYEYDLTADVPKMRFNREVYYPIWTTTPARPDQVLLRSLAPGAGLLVVGVAAKRAEFFLIGATSVFCVRVTEPDLAPLAGESWPYRPVASLAELQAVRLVVQAEAAIAGDHFNESIKVLQNALSLDPKSIRAYEDEAMASAYISHFDDAEKALKTASHIDSTALRPIRLAAWLKQVKKQSSKDPRAVAGWVLVHDADTALAQANWESALDLANHIISMEPAWPEGKDRLGQALAGQDRWQEAVAAWSEAQKLDKHNETNARQELKDAEKSIKNGPKGT